MSTVGGTLMRAAALKGRIGGAMIAIVAFLGWPAATHAAPAPLAALAERAEAGDADALTELGLRYGHGEGVAQDWGRAAALYCRAAGQGHAGAAYQLAMMRLYGRGAERDDA